MPHWDRSTTTHSGRHVNALWPHGMTNVEKARNGVGYLMKYLSKIGDVAAFPHHLRLYGVGGLTPQARMVRGWYNLPEWAKREYGVGDLKRLDHISWSSKPAKSSTPCTCADSYLAEFCSSRLGTCPTVFTMGPTPGFQLMNWRRQAARALVCPGVFLVRVQLRKLAELYFFWSSWLVVLLLRSEP